CATSSAAVALAVAAATAERWSLLLLGAVAGAAAAAHAAHRRLAARHADLAALYELTQRLAGCSEEQDVLREVLLGVQQALSCQRSQLLVLRRAGPLRYALDDTTTMTVQQLPAAPAIVDLLVEGRDAVLAPRGARHHLGEALAASGFDDAMVVRLPSDVGDPRLLVVADRTTGTFTAADIPFLQTLAAQCAVSLRGTRLLDELRSEVASREHDALHDSLTRLGNRALFSRRCGEALARQRPNSAVVVMLLDLDGFKEINDTLGHHVGDLVLQQVAHRLRTQVGGRGVPTRLGGDEFAIVYPAVSVKADVRAVAREVSEAVSRPMDLGDLAITVQASIGISMAPGHGNDSATLLKCADVAMYAAKASAERISVYTSTGDQHSTRRLLLASELRRAAEAEELVLHYQPKADLQTGAVLGFEALLRWSHPTFGEVSPSEFIPVAEQAGLIDGMTWWVLAEALRQQRVWAAAGYDLSVAVNISARSLLDGRLASRLSRLLTSSGVPPERLVLEVTETSVMADAERSAAILDGAAALGVRISVDDFGTGYSSLSRLLEMPVHEIKVDRSFVTTMLQSSDNLAIVQSTVNLALSMGRKVTAEGVEDEATWEELRRLGCHAVQGYVLARAMAGERTVVWLGEYEAAMAQARADAWEAQRAVAVAVDGDGAAVGAPA
ncbi:MAG TPA: EAL domain-containing protein, partial [Acidimicrobiales bacterium]|nr:EAL domain-containing protein [Acidimicrobiales bacterium]